MVAVYKSKLNNGTPTDAFRQFTSIIDSTPSVLDKLLSDPEVRQQIVNVLPNFVSSFNSLSKIIERKEITQLEAAKIFDDILSSPAKHSYVPYILANLNEKEITAENGKRRQMIFEKSVATFVDTYKGSTKEYKEFITSASNMFRDLMGSPVRKDMATFYENLPLTTKRKFAGTYIGAGDFATRAAETMMDDKQLIKPIGKLDKTRIAQILKYNNVTGEDSKLPAADIRDFAAMDAYIKRNHSKTEVLRKQHITAVDKTVTDMERLTAKMHKQKRSNKHGPNGMKFIREFNVAIPEQVEAQEKWIAANPSQDIIFPMFHGTGSIAASMILRYGFRVVSAGDSSVVGRMLGDGIYGAIHIDKSQQYVGDNGYGRSIGTRGYLFEAKVALGVKDKDYKAMGLDNRDGIRSPEWCVFTPNSQFKITKAYEVELISESEMRSIIAKVGPLNEEKGVTRFKKFINEGFSEMGVMNVKTYTFVNGLIPMTHDPRDVVELEDFKAPNPAVSLEPSAYGPTVVVRDTEESGDFLFTSPADFAANYPEEFEKYVAYLTKIK